VSDGGKDTIYIAEFGSKSLIRRQRRGRTAVYEGVKAAASAAGFIKFS
jgi:hypothetical protein